MSELKFNCPACNQPLAEDESRSGSQIACPQCGKPVTVPPSVPKPPAEARLRLRIATNSPAGPPSTPDSPAPAAPSAAFPPPPNVPTPGAAGLQMAPHQSLTTQARQTVFVSAPVEAPRRSGLAIASLICSIGSLCVIPFGFVPGIICGHMARKRMAENRALLGAGMAKAGLVIGYLSLVVHLALAALVVASVYYAVNWLPKIPRPGAPPSQATAPTQPLQPPRPEAPPDLLPDSSGWTLDLIPVEIPAHPVEGRVAGTKFSAERVFLQGGWLHFRQGQDFLADQEMRVVLFEPDAPKLAGQKIRVFPKTPTSGPRPHIWVGWREGETKTSAQRTFTDDYSMLLEFGDFQDGRLSGRIYLCVPDAKKSFIRGTFECEVKDARK